MPCAGIEGEYSTGPGDIAGPPETPPLAENPRARTQDAIVRGFGGQTPTSSPRGAARHASCAALRLGSSPALEERGEGQSRRSPRLDPVRAAGGSPLRRFAHGRTHGHDRRQRGRRVRRPSNESRSTRSRRPRRWASWPTSGRPGQKNIWGTSRRHRDAERGRRRRRRARRPAGRRADHDLHGVAGPAADDPQHVQDRRRADADGLPRRGAHAWPRTPVDLRRPQRRDGGAGHRLRACSPRLVQEAHGHGADRAGGDARVARAVHALLRRLPHLARGQQDRGADDDDMRR
jgi:hypothetical protein